MGFNLFLAIDLNLLTLGFFIVKFLCCLYETSLPEEKKSSSGAKVIGWLICCQNMRALRIHNAPILQILCARDSEQIEIFFPTLSIICKSPCSCQTLFLICLNTRGTLQCFLGFQSLGQNPKGAKPTSGAYYQWAPANFKHALWFNVY